MFEKTALVTGGAGGLGGRTSQILAERGWTVFAADFDTNALGALAERPGIFPLEIDVTSRASVEAAREHVASRTDGLDAVVNFAGILSVGSMIEVSEADFSRILDVNLMGTFRVNQVFFPLLLARRGRIVDISSETGWQSAMPFNGPYAISKHAIEAYSDALRRELVLLGIAVIKIQPGPFKTGMVASIGRSFDRAAEGSQHFAALLRHFKDLTVREQAKAHDPALVAEAVHTALTATRPRPAYSVKADRLRALLQWLPTRWLDRLLALFLRRVRVR